MFDQLACTSAKGFALLNGANLEYLAKPGLSNHTRFNDGGCDSKGRFFAGTVCSKDHEIPGQLYRYDPADNSCVVVDEGPFTVRPLCSASLICRALLLRRILMELGGVRTKKRCQSALKLYDKRRHLLTYFYPSYFTDSLVNFIYAYDYDDGNLSNRRTLVDARSLGYPDETFCDGLCVDTDGGIWSARSAVRIVILMIELTGPGIGGADRV